MRRRAAARRGVTIVTLAGAAASLSVPAVALAQTGALTALATGTAAVGTATWAAVATQAAGPPYPTGPLTLTFAPGPGGRQLFSVVNTGSVALTGASYAATAAGKITPTLTACVGGSWNAATGACVGGKVTTVSGSSAVVPAAPGSAVQLECTIKGRIKQAVTVTVSVSVTNGADTAAGGVTNS